MNLKELSDAYMRGDFDSDSGEDNEGQRIVVGMMNEIHQRQTRIQRPHGGTSGNRRYFPRDHEAGHLQLMADYFNPGCLYPPEKFRRRFRMSPSLFDRILQEVTNANNYFQQRPDCIGKPGFTPHQKVTAAMRMLAYGSSADAVDEYLRMGESTARECLQAFCDTVVRIYETEFLRKPTQEDIDKLLHKGESRGFPGMLGSLDCMHWEWKNCPSAWQGQFVGHYHRPTIVLEAVASYDTWIWHAFFGMPGSHNDISVLDCSHLFDELAEGHGPTINYYVNDKLHTTGYYLTDGIYPAWGTLVKSISQPQTRMLKYFAIEQEKHRKDVERAFGVLQSRFAIIKGPARPWQLDFLGKIMKTCIILHNMIVENERPLVEQCQRRTRRNGEEEYESLPGAERIQQLPANLDVFLARFTQIRSSRRYDELKEDLINHVWNHKGAQP